MERVTAQDPRESVAQRGEGLPHLLLLNQSSYPNEREDYSDLITVDRRYVVGLSTKAEIDKLN